MSKPSTPFTFLIGAAAQASRPAPVVKDTTPRKIQATLAKCLAVMGETGPVVVPAVGAYPEKTLPTLHCYIVEYPESATFEAGVKRKRTIRLAASNPYFVATRVPLPVNADGTVPVPDFDCEVKMGLTRASQTLASMLLLAAGGKK